MKLTIVGGGGFRVPLVYRALVADHGSPRIDEISLYDVDPARVTVIARVLAEQGTGIADAPRVAVCTDLREALQGADFVFCAMRVGGLAGRIVDESAALRLGLLGQETTGPGGIAFALRTLPVARRLADAVAEICPDAWVINFTNPAGIITEAMSTVLGTRVIGVCDSADGLVVRAARALGLSRGEVRADYVGLNHLGWLRHLYHCDASGGEIDVLPRLLGDAARLATVEEARLMGTAWVQALGMIPNEYLYFYYCTRESIGAIVDAPTTRGQFLDRQQTEFYRHASEREAGVLALWDQARRSRDETYLAELRDAEHTGPRDEEDVTHGGYEKIALRLVDSLMRGSSQRLILNVVGDGSIPGIPAGAVVEVPCDVGASGARPVALAPVTGHVLGLMIQVKAVEQLAIEAATCGSRALARKALALHPLVDSVAVAGQLLGQYLKQSPELAAALPNEGVAACG